MGHRKEKQQSKKKDKQKNKKSAVAEDNIYVDIEEPSYARTLPKYRNVYETELPSRGWLGDTWTGEGPAPGVANGGYMGPGSGEGSISGGQVTRGGTRSREGSISGGQVTRGGTRSREGSISGRLGGYGDSGSQRGSLIGGQGGGRYVGEAEGSAGSVSWSQAGDMAGRTASPGGTWGQGGWREPKKASGGSDIGTLGFVGAQESPDIRRGDVLKLQGVGPAYQNESFDNETGYQELGRDGKDGKGSLAGKAKRGKGRGSGEEEGQGGSGWKKACIAGIIIAVVVGIAAVIAILWYFVFRMEGSACASSPCQNSGTCEDVGESFTCVCPPLYTGKLCDQANLCSSSPCLNSGRCDVRDDIVTCECVNGFEGTHCEIVTGLCTEAPCKSGGTCSQDGDRITCACLEGYEGTLCQSEVDECSSSPCLNGGSCEDKLAAYKCACVSGYSGINCETSLQPSTLLVQPTTSSVSHTTPVPRTTTGAATNQTSGVRVGFCAYHPSSHASTSTWRGVEWTKTHSDYGEGYQKPDFSSPSSDLYFLSLAGQMASGQKLGYTLTGSPTSVGISRTSTAHNHIDTVGRSLLLRLPEGTSVHVSYTGDLECCRGTTWSMFSLTAAMSPLVAFSVARSTSWITTGPIDYGLTLSDAGIDDQSTFTVPRKGAYFFSVSTGLKPGKGVTLLLKQNNITKLELTRNSTVHNGIDMISSGAMLDCEVGDRIHVELEAGSTHCSPEYKELAFSGFLYAPRDDSYAWSVHRSTTYEGGDSALDPLTFDVVRVNQGGVWDAGSDVVTVPVSGLYYVHISVAVQPLTSALVYIKVGDQPPGGTQVAEIYSGDTNNNGVDTVSHGLLLTLTQGQRVWVKARVDPGYDFYSNTNLFTGFTGFLVYKT